MAINPHDFKIGASVLKSPPIEASLAEIQYSLFEIYSDRYRVDDKGVSLEKEALRKAEEEGIIFLDEIDKLAVPSSSTQRTISREGVQRDLLPIIEGTTISTKIGDICTDNILFIASGAFSMSKVEDLMPELLGRLPIRAEMTPISQ